MSHTDFETKGAPVLKLLLDFLAAHVFLAGVGLLLFLGAFVSALFFRYIPNNRVGIVEKLVERARARSQSGLIALDGEAGFQPDVLRGGWHFLMPFQYRVHSDAARHDPAGQDRLRLRARRRSRSPPTQTLALERRRRTTSRTPRRSSRDGGQRGPQRQILREGTYAINLAQFVVITEEQLYYLPLDRRRGRRLHADGAAHRRARRLHARSSSRARTTSIGIVTVHDGPSLAAGRDHRADRRRRSGGRRRPTTTTSRTRSASSRPAAGAAASSRCWSRARTTSTASSRPSR